MATIKMEGVETYIEMLSKLGDATDEIIPRAIIKGRDVLASALKRANAVFSRYVRRTKPKKNDYDIGGNKISEDFTMKSDTPVAGAKAFAQVTSVVLPVKVGTETIDLGWGASFGLPYALAADELVIVKLFNGAADTGTVTVDATDVSKNVSAINGTPDGKKALDFYIVV